MAASKSLRNLRLVLWGAVLVAGLGATWALMPGAQQEELSTLTLGKGDYRLETTDGGSFTEASLKGQPSLVFFGFTHCPDVCPTTMGDVMAWKEALGRQGEVLKVWIITVDPERDTLPVMHDYVSWLPGATGVTGSAEETAKALEAFRIYARKSDLGGGDYAVDHTAYVMLFDKDGNYSQIFRYQEDPEQVTDELRRFLGGAA